MKQSNQKLKLLYLMQILLAQTDEEHTLTVPQMIAELGKLGISAERKSIYDDLECLRLFGLDICTRKSRTTDYFVASREFELPELKLLVDSVQSSKFITHKKSLELIGKIETLTSKYNAKKLQRQVFVTNRVKTLNEQIYYNVDQIHEAIAENRQITFRYFDTDVNKKRVYRKDGQRYTESPVALTWDDENYYLIKVRGVEPASLLAGPFRFFSVCRPCLAPARLRPPREKVLENFSARSAKQFPASRVLSGQGRARREYWRISKGDDTARAELCRRKPACVRLPSPYL